MIASYPTPNRDEARVLIYDRKSDTITHEVFKNILNYLDEDIEFIFNDTKVIKARIFGHKKSGGKVELLFNRPLVENYLVYIRGKVKIGTELFFDENLKAIVLELNEDGSRVVEFFQNDKKLDFLELTEILNIIGHIPLPPYLNRSDEKSDEREYQTLFAKNYGAVAAPTASLHFSESILNQIKNKNFLTLHVGAGTFKPVDVENILEHKMHSEFYNIPDKTAQIIDSDKKIVAVGTTATRTIEYYARTKIKNDECDLFLHPKNKPIRVNNLITNFHLPKSTLIMLVSAFIGREKTLEIYQEAIKEKYRFFSYGDAMMIL